jgi:hypothetical protein
MIHLVAMAVAVAVLAHPVVAKHAKRQASLSFLISLLS